MDIHVKDSEIDKYIEIDLSEKDWENIKRGRYPSKLEIVLGSPVTISVGYKRQ